MSSNAGRQENMFERDERTLSRDALMLLDRGTILAKDALLPLLMSPDGHGALTFSADSDCLVDEAGNCYPFRGDIPLLIPSPLMRFYTDHLKIDQSAVTDSFLQYYFLSSVKHAGVVTEINAPADSIDYQRHLFRMRSFLHTARGLVLDVGCDDPEIGAALLPPSTRYVGLDPFCRRLQPFRVIGFGEQLPFLNNSFDCIMFNTSLDHILDWRRAIGEARRVLVPGGLLYISTLIWTDRADLVTDAVHFHHFRDYEIFGALQDWGPVEERRYDYKGASHRHGLYLSVRKPGQKRA